jgi:hypothetical protein
LAYRALNRELAAAPPAGAKSETHRDLTLARLASRQQQAGRIPARRKKQNARCGEENQQRPARAAGQIALPSFQRHIPANVFGELRRQALGGRVNGSTCGSETDAGSKPAHHRKGAVATLIQFVLRDDQRRPFVRRGMYVAGGNDADDV